MKIIALTGGIASGKSTVARMLEARGAEIIDADVAARKVVAPGQPALAAIADRFGPSMITSDGYLDRSKLGHLVFSDPAKRRDLEAITHPAIREQMTAELAAAGERNVALAVMDIPLLFETGNALQYDGNIMLVYVPRDLQLQRLLNRDTLTEAQAESRLESQLPIDSKRAMATWIVDNTGSLADTGTQIDRWWETEIG